MISAGEENVAGAKRGIPLQHLQLERPAGVSNREKPLDEYIVDVAGAALSFLLGIKPAYAQPGPGVDPTLLYQMQFTQMDVNGVSSSLNLLQQSWDRKPQDRPVIERIFVNWVQEKVGQLAEGQNRSALEQLNDIAQRFPISELRRKVPTILQETISEQGVEALSRAVYSSVTSPIAHTGDFEKSAALLEMTKNRKAADTFLSVLTESRNANYRRQAAEALGRLGQTHVIGSISTRLTVEKDATVITAMQGSLTQLREVTDSLPNAEQNFPTAFAVSLEAGLPLEIQALQKAIDDTLRGNLANTGRFTVIDQDSEKLALRLQEESLQDHRGASPLKLGNMASAQKAVVARLSKVGDQCRIFLDYMDVETGSTEKSVDKTAVCQPGAVIGQITQAVWDLAGQL